MNACLYCAVDLRDSPLSDEHIVPEVLGGWLKHRCICKSHNEQYGSYLESKLKKNAFVARAIYSLGLQNLDKAYRHGRVTIETPDGRELRGTISGSEPRLTKMESTASVASAPFFWHGTYRISRTFHAKLPGSWLILALLSLRRNSIA